MSARIEIVSGCVLLVQDFFFVGGFGFCRETGIPHLNCSRHTSIIARRPLFIMANKVGRGNSPVRCITVKHYIAEMV